MVRFPGLLTVTGAGTTGRGATESIVGRWVVALVAVGVSSLAIVAVLPVPAAAHTDLLQASPGPGQRAGGEIDFVDLAFLEPVTDATVEVVHDGQIVPGSMTVTDGSIIRFEFDEPLTTAGTYDVDYAMTSFDLDATIGRFSFTYEPDAPQARRIGTVEPEARNWVPIVATGVLVAALAGAAFVFLARLDARRRAGPDGGGRPADESQANTR